MTADNLTFALEIDFIPDLQEGRDDFKKKMKSVAEKIDGSYTLDQKSRPIISGLTKEDIEKDIDVLQVLDIQHVSYYSLILEEGTILKYSPVPSQPLFPCVL